GIASAAGVLYYTESLNGRLGYITTGGSAGDFAPAFTNPSGIANGGEGRIWLVDGLGDTVFAGAMWVNSPTPYTYHLPASSAPVDLALGTDGRMWAAEYEADAIAACDPTGTTCAQYPLASGSSPRGIAAGPDGNMWITESGSNKIAKMSAVGAVIHEYP